MQPASSVFARLGQSLNQACASLHEAGTQFAASAAGHMEHALTCCRRPVRPQPPIGPAAHEVAPPLGQRQADILPDGHGIATPGYQRVQRLQRTMADLEVAIANDPGQHTRHVLAAFEDILDGRR